MPSKTLHIPVLVSGIGLLGAVSVALGVGEIRFMPVAADGNVICLPGEGACGETEIMLWEGGVEVTLFIEISAWDTETPHPGDVNFWLGSAEGTVDHSTYEGGIPGNPETTPGLDLTPVGADTGMGREGAFQAVKVCTSAPYGCGPEQNLLSMCYTGGNCAMGELCMDRCDYVLYHLDGTSHISTATADYYWGAATVDCREDPRDGSRFYLGTLLLEVPPAATGTYNVAFIDGHDFSILHSCPGPVFPDLTLRAAQITVPAVHSIPKHRYVSINPTAYGEGTYALRMDLVSMKRCSGNLERACTFDNDCEEAIPGSGTCVEHPDVGSSWWVQQAQQEPLGCLPGNICGPDDYFARVADTPVIREWTQEWLHIGDCEVVPGATYEVRGCSGPGATVCGDPQTIGTTRQSILLPGFRGNFGDIAGAPSFAGAPFGSPDGFTNIIDFSAVYFTQQNYGTQNQPQAHPTWVDLHGLGDGIPPNYIINVSDLQVLKKALIGGEWTDFGGALNPGDCP